MIVALNVADGIVSYGILDVGDTNNTFDGNAIADTQLITSDANVSINVLLRSSDAAAAGTPGVTDRALEGTIGADIFVHYYDLAADGSFVAFPFSGDFDNTNTTSVVTLAVKNDTAPLDLKIDMPSSTGDLTEHSIEVTAIATAT